MKGGDGWVKGQKQPFTSKSLVFIGVSEPKVKGEGYLGYSLVAILIFKLPKLEQTYSLLYLFVYIMASCTYVDAKSQFRLLSLRKIYTLLNFNAIFNRAYIKFRPIVCLY